MLGRAIGTLTVEDGYVHLTGVSDKQLKRNAREEIQLTARVVDVEGKRALANGWIAAEPQRARRQFWLMPMLHSENALVVEQAIPLLERFADPGTAAIARANLAELQRHGHYRRRRQR